MVFGPAGCWVAVEIEGPVEVVGAGWGIADEEEDVEAVDFEGVLGHGGGR